MQTERPRFEYKIVSNLNNRSWKTMGTLYLPISKPVVYMSKLRWPYGTLSVVDEENHSVVCVHCMVISECSEAFEMIMMLETSDAQLTKVIRKDDLASPASLQLSLHLPALLLAGLCNFHIREINFREHVKHHPFCEQILCTFRSWLQEARVSTQIWETVNFPKFCAQWPGPESS